MSASEGNVPVPKVGVAVFIRKDGKILMGHRMGAHGGNTWAPPGGKLDFGEDVASCARREVFEETNLKIKNIRAGPYTNDVFVENNLHYITLFMVAEYDSGELKIMEPNKCKEWRWVEWNNLPHPLFLPLQNLLKTNFNPFWP